MSEEAEFIVSLPSDPGLKEAVGEVAGVTFLEWDLTAPAPAERIDIVVPAYTAGAAPLAALKDVDTRLVQWQMIGYDALPQYLPEGLPVANAATVHETATSELAVALTLAALREIPGYTRQMASGTWSPLFGSGLADKRVLLIGYGGICKQVEARLAGFEVRSITRMASRVREEANLAGETVHVHEFSELDALLPEADVVILAVPLTDATRHMLDAASLELLPDGALVVNVARGPVVHTEALITELESGRLRAALDVTDPEPLPAEHPLWSNPNVLVVPHVGGETHARLPRMGDLIRRQIAHLRQGEVPENLVLGAWNEGETRRG